jgi:hypothetical protein
MNMADHSEEEQRGAQSRASAAFTPRGTENVGVKPEVIEEVETRGTTLMKEMANREVTIELEAETISAESVEALTNGRVTIGPKSAFLPDEEWKKLDDTLGGVVPSNAEDMKKKYIALLDEWERLKLVELELKSKTHVVVTRASRGDGAVKVVHAYGPFTKTKARAERNSILNDFDKSGTDGNEVLVSVCRMIDIDAMNAALVARPPKDWPTR